MARPEVALALLLAACAPAAEPPEAAELWNLRAYNAVPKSSPAVLVGEFARACLDGPAAPEDAARALAARGYLEAPAVGDDALRSFVVDDSRPLVMLAPDGRGCAVAARARTGQAARLRALVAERFPEARALAPETVGAGVLEAWQTPAGVIVLQRATTPPGADRRVIVGRIGAPAQVS